MKRKELKAPFPWPGGKGRVADEIWRRFGNVDNYCEPFAGTAAVLLRRPAWHFAGAHRKETVNDKNHFVVNLWRAVAADPDGVAKWVDWPVTEADLHARHRWLMRSEASLEWRRRMKEDPDHYDAKVAGWWVWGQCCWIGSGWCPDAGGESEQMPELASGVGRGLTAAHTGAAQVPLLSHAGGKGVDALATASGRPQLADAFDIGRGVNGGAAELNLKRIALSIANGYDAVGNAQPEQVGSLQRPDLGGGNSAAIGGIATLPMNATCEARAAWLRGWMRELCDRLRLVRVCYGDWHRICDSDSTLTRLGTTGVFLDPPYPTKSVSGKKSRSPDLYATDRGSDLDKLRDEVLAWCRRWGGDPNIRVAVCGYEGDGYESLGWAEWAWEAQGGYGNQSGGKSANAKRERVWFNAACLTGAADLFAGVGA